ncbi:ATP-dependent DNA helicase sgs1, partial [Podila epigama]
ETMEKFKNGEFKILLATDAAGMGCDIPDVEHVIQYGLPSDLKSLVQRFGRAARDEKIVPRGIVTLLAPEMTSGKYDTKGDLKELVDAATKGRCCWKLIAKRFDMEIICNRSCQGCTGTPFSTMNPLKEFKKVAKIPKEERSEEEKRFAAKKFKEWRTKASLNGLGKKTMFNAGPGYLPGDILTMLCERLTHSTTAKGVREICQDAGWRPLGGDGHYDELAKVAVTILKELDNPP